MTTRPEVLTISLARDSAAEQKAALTELSARLGMYGISALTRWLADIYAAAPDATTILLEAAGNRANGGDEWRTLADMRALLPALSLTVEEQSGREVGQRVETWLQKLAILRAGGQQVSLADIAATDLEGYAALLKIIEEDNRQ